MSTKTIRLTNGNDTVLPESAESGANYCKMADGTLIQWGLDIVPANLWSITIYFPKTFVNTNYSIMLNCYDNVGGHMWASYHLAIDSCSCYVDELSSYSRYFMWFAIGRWK